MLDSCLCSEEEAKFGARRLARSLQKLGFQVILMKKDLCCLSNDGTHFFRNITKVRKHNHLAINMFSFRCPFCISISFPDASQRNVLFCGFGFHLMDQNCAFSLPNEQQNLLKEPPTNVSWLEKYLERFIWKKC